MNFKKEDRKNHFEEYNDIDNFDSDDFYYYDDTQNTNKFKRSIKLTDILCIIIIILLIAILIGKFDFFKDDSKVVSSTNQNETALLQEETNQSEENYQNIEVSNNQVKTLYVQSTSQTSQLYDVTNKDYSSSRVLDGDLSTVWSEGVTGYGLGEWIKLDFEHVQTVNAIKIVNGLVNNKNGYYRNNRVESLILEFSDGSTQTIYLQDNDTSYQTVQINPIDTTYVKCIINSVYPGSKYNDTCIAEIKLLGY